MVEEAELTHETISDDVLQDLDDEQIREYQDMLKQLGAYPDKVLINTLSMIAQDYSVSFPKSAACLYKCIRELLLSSDVRPDCKLPLVYVIDSILKNVKGLYIEIMREDIKLWMGPVFQMLGENELEKTKLRKVWNTWNEFKIFPEDDWKVMGKSFTDEDEKLAAAKMAADAKTKAAGINRAPDGSLMLGINLRKQMQAVLDDVQADETDELKKVSLERLADINPDLLVKIKDAAEEILEQSRISGPSDASRPIALDGVQDDAPPPLFMEIRPQEIVKRGAEWEKLDLNYLKSTNDSIKKLLHTVRNGTSSKVQAESSNDITRLLSSVSATATSLTQMLGRYKTQNDNNGLISFSAGPIPSHLPGLLPSFYRNTMMSTKSVDRSKFTSEGLKEKNDSVIARLYDGGLPFVCFADGRRFATQIEQSKHLDEIFRKRQLESSMERSDERGWYQMSDTTWSGQSVAGIYDGEINDIAGREDGTDDTADPESCMVNADDETRGSCAICGINFPMKFDQEEGEWKYTNCREIEVLNDDVAEVESESMLVHVTCLRALGSPQVLTIDQVLQS